jgi:hypothetical protein
MFIKIFKKITAIGIIVLSVSASPATAGAKTKISVLFQDFPKGTQCGASGTTGKVKLKKKRGHPIVDIKGYAEIGTIFCDLPDGRRIVTDINKKLKKDARVVGVTIYPSGDAYLTSSTESGLFSEQMTGRLKLAK